MKGISKGIRTIIVALATVIVAVTAYGFLTDKPNESEGTAITDATRTTTATKETATETKTSVQEKVSESNGKEAKEVITKAEIEKATGKTLKKDTVVEIQEALSDGKVWEKLGYPTGTAKRVAARFKESQKQAQGILTSIAMENDESLKVIVLEKNVSIGTTDDGEPDMTEETEKPATKTALGDIKELSVEIDFGQSEIEFDWEVEDNGQIDATYENGQTNERLAGKAAQSFVEKIVSGIDFKRLTKEETYEAIAKKLNLSDKNVTSFSYSVDYFDRTEIENDLTFK